MGMSGMQKSALEGAMHYEETEASLCGASDSGRDDRA